MTEEEIKAALSLLGNEYRLIVWKTGFHWIASIKRLEQRLWVTMLLAYGDTKEDAVRRVGIQFQNEEGELKPLYDSQR